MADLTITAASVTPSASPLAAIPNSQPRYTTGTAGETITAGMPVYISPSTSKLMKALNDTAAHANVIGIALTGGSNGQIITYQTSGQITIGATVAVGATYNVSANAGGIAPAADLGSGDYFTQIGIGVGTTDIMLTLVTTGAAKA